MPKPVVILFIIFFLVSCRGNKNSNQDKVEDKIVLSEETLAKLRRYKGLGPITSISLDKEIDMNMVNRGKAVFMTMCTSCHKPNEDFIGPSPAGILERRSPEWIMNMILNPEEMNQKDSLARAIYEQYNRSPMSNQFLSERQAREILEYFRTL
jgi:mono/diheme cytochrome c family protein